MSTTNDNEQWHDCNFIAEIKKYDLEPKASKEPYEIIDDYDARCALGGRFHTFKSRFDRMEC